MSVVWGLLLMAAPVGYAWQMLRFRGAWHKLAQPTPAPSDSENNRSAAKATAGQATTAPAQGSDIRELTVVIAARNEATNLPALLADLQRQTMPATAFEVIIVDDHSDDATAALVRQAAASSRFALRLIRLAEQPGPPVRGKKAALQAAISLARGEWIVCTDADCRVGEQWLALHHLAHAADAHFVSGPVLLTGRGALAALQGLELAGLVGAGAAGIGLGQPTMCNGANLSYRRSSFGQVGGFASNQHIASGDDEFLLHQLHAQYPSGIRFLQHPGAVVRTAAQPTLRQLLRQRVRWASKWAHYRTATPRRLAVMVLLANLALAAGVAALAGWPAFWPWVLAAAATKLGADVLFLGPVLSFLGHRRWLWWVPVLQLVYAPYTAAVGVAGLRGGYEWKGRHTR